MRYELNYLKLAPNQSEILPNTDEVFPASAYLGDLENYVTKEVPWHWHKEFEFAVVLKGTARIYLGENETILPSGYGIFCNSNILHRYAIEGSENCIFHSVVVDSSILGGSAESVFNIKYINPLTKAHSLPYVLFSPDDDWQSSCIKSIESAHIAITVENEGYEFEVREEISKICMQILRHYKKQIFSSSRTTSIDARRIRKLLDYIQEHYQEQITLQNLADTVNLCPRECQRCFKKVLHMSPTEYILQYRLGISIDLLASTDLSVTQISESVGFNSPSYFGKMFRKTFGKSPNEYREMK